MSATCHPGRPHKAHGLCDSCYNRSRYAETVPNADQRSDRDDRLDDLTWMYETGEHAEGAAHRLGITLRALDKWCRRNGHVALLNALMDRNPVPVGAHRNQYQAAAA